MPFVEVGGTSGIDRIKASRHHGEPEVIILAAPPRFPEWRRLIEQEPLEDAAAEEAIAISTTMFQVACMAFHDSMLAHWLQSQSADPLGSYQGMILFQQFRARALAMQQQMNSATTKPDVEDEQ